MKVTIAPPLPSLSRVHPPKRHPLRVALVQTSWSANQLEHQAVLREGIEAAAQAGARIVFMQELTLSRYPADTQPIGIPNATAENLENGPTFEFARQAAADNGIFVHASLFEYENLPDGRGWNTAIVVSPQGEVVAKTRKLHIPVTAGYYEDEYFTPGSAQGTASDTDPYPVHVFDGLDARFGLPTCWDEWFPEVARNYSLRGAEILVYPTAIGSEPDHPDFDTEPLWQQVIFGNAIANGTFMVVPNRWGNEGAIDFYGSSFICDPYGRVLAQAGRTGNEVLVADLDLDQRRDWLDLFPFLATRRPDTYGRLVEPVANLRGSDGAGVKGGIAGIEPDEQ